MSEGTLDVAVRILRRCSRGEGRRIAGGLLLLGAASGITVLQPWPLKLVVDSVVGDAPPPAWIASAARTLAAPFGAAESSRLPLLATLCVSMLALQAAAGALTVLSYLLLVRSGLSMVFRLRCTLFDHVQRLSLRYHDATPVGDSLYRVTWDTYSVQSLFNEGLVPFVTESFTLAAIAVVMLTRDASAALLALGVVVPLFLLLRKFDKPMGEFAQHAQERESAVSARVQETLSGIRVVKAFGREDAETERFRGRAGESLRASLRLTLLQSASQAAIALLLAAGSAAVVWFAGSRAIEGRLTPGDVVLFVAYVAMVFKPVGTLSYAAVQVQRSAAGARRVLAVLEERQAAVDAPHAVALPGRAEGRVAIEDVTFAYRGEKRILNGLSIDVPAGSMLALVGSSGAGKTTVASLLLRFYDPDSGRVTLDGRDLREIRLDSLRRQIAIVPQEPVLFSTSVRENIAYGRPGATFEEIEAAARAAEADEFIRGLPEGYETEVGERGVALSVGQRQRISIARAYLADAPVLVLDEPTSALDAETEAALVAGFARLAKGRTTIVIAHRLSTIRAADSIAVVRDGRIVESGTPGELLARGGAFARMDLLQSGRAAAPQP